MPTLTLDAWLHRTPSPVPALLCVFTDELLFNTQATDTYRTALRCQGPVQRTVVEMDKQFNPEQFINLFANQSLFGDVQLIDLRLYTDKLSSDAVRAINTVVPWLQGANRQDSASHHLLLSGPTLNKTQRQAAGFSTVLNTGTEVVCKTLDRNSLPGWIQHEAKRKGFALEPQACTWLAESTEGNLLATHQALEKLALLEIKPAQAISLTTVQTTLNNNARYNVFELGAAVLAGNHARIVRMLQGLEAEGQASTLVLWVLQEEIRAIALVRELLANGQPLAQACKQARIWGERQQQLPSALKRHNATTLAPLRHWCHLADKTIKGLQAGNPWTPLHIIAQGIAGYPTPLPIS